MHVTKRKQRFLPRAALPALVLLVLLFVGCICGVCTAGPLCVVLTTIVLICCSAAAVFQARIVERIQALAFIRRGIVRALVLIAISILCFVSIEIPWNGSLFLMHPRFFFLNLAIIAPIVAAFYFLGQRHAAFVRIPIIASMIIGIAEYFVLSFKGTVILPVDILSLGTAFSVSSQYSYTLSSSALAGIACTCVAWRAAAFACPPAHLPARTILSRLIDLLIALALFVFSGLFITQPDYTDDFGIDIYFWWPLDSYSEYGMLPSFISCVQSLEVEEPKGYTQDAADELQSSYAESYEESQQLSETASARAEQFAEEQPTVIAVMNETFCDLSALYDGLGADYEGPEFFSTWSDTAEKGKLAVSVHGAGTCNSEFEFLTGLSLSLFGATSHPYTLYNLESCDSLVSQFEELGYKTSAMHPNSATNWRRDVTYAQLGFDTFYDIDDFEDADTLRELVTDGATYDKILELLEEDDSPQFIFDVTMQNHGGYETGRIPASLRTDYASSAFDDSEVNAKLNEYLACIDASDRDLEEFIEALSQLDRPVVLVFFGDHQPSFSSTYNDGLYPDEADEAEHAMRIYQSNYAIWTNYELAGDDDDGDDEASSITSVSYLGALLKEIIGAPLTEYQQAQLALSEELPAISGTGYQDASGTWHLADDGESLDAYMDSLHIEYLRAKQELLD